MSYYDQSPVYFNSMLLGVLPGSACANAHGTPATAAVHYNRGGILVRSYDDEDTLQSALDMLLLAREIYVANGREREAGYTATFEALAQQKLGRHEEARASLSYARERLTEEDDKPAFDFARRIEADLDSSEDPISRG